MTLATVWEDMDERHALEGWKSQGVTVLACKLTRPRKIINLLSALPTRKPLQSVYCWEPKLIKMVQEHWLKSKNYTAVHIEHIRGTPFGLSIKKWTTSADMIGDRTDRPPLVWDSVDCISLLFEKAARSSRSAFGRLATTIDLPRTRKYEGWLATQFDRTLVTSPADQNALSDLVRKYQSENSAGPQAMENQSPITVISNGVDLANFQPNYGRRKDSTLVMTGKMSYHANVTAAFYLVESVMPLVWEKNPEVKVQIVGANPATEIYGLAARYPDKVEVTGTVPSVALYLRDATIAVAPIAYGVGIQNKVLEAMACAAPVVCTPQAVSALKTENGNELLVGESPAEFAADILKLLENSDLRRTIGAVGRRYVESNHSWDEKVKQLEEIYTGRL